MNHNPPSPLLPICIHIAKNGTVQLFRSTPTDMADDVICEMTGINHKRKIENAAAITKALNRSVLWEEMLELAQWVQTSLKPDERPENVDDLIRRAEAL